MFLKRIPQFSDLITAPDRKASECTQTVRSEAFCLKYWILLRSAAAQQSQGDLRHVGDEQQDKQCGDDQRNDRF